ncbi:MAG: hypothetical protein KGJ40_06545 [candidate division NC10 bacterium]|nr:hypothetical protein [candidate division NC10 bacterium]MDE2484220.1 hypothetical protein [candidate division NC10 bacterium]
MKVSSAKASAKAAPTRKKATKQVPDVVEKVQQKSLGFNEKGNVGLTVRIEINLPAQGDQETHDRIFQSIKQNLLNG